MKMNETYMPCFALALHHQGNKSICPINMNARLKSAQFADSKSHILASCMVRNEHTLSSIMVQSLLWAVSANCISDFFFVVSLFVSSVGLTGGSGRASNLPSPIVTSINDNDNSCTHCLIHASMYQHCSAIKDVSLSWHCLLWMVPMAKPRVPLNLPIWWSSPCPMKQLHLTWPPSSPSTMIPAVHLMIYWSWLLHQRSGFAHWVPARASRC